MTERIIEITEQGAYLSLENHLVKISLKDGKTATLPVSEIQCLILGNPAVTITGALLAELANAGVMTVVSGSNRLPVSMHLPLDGNYIQNERFRAQVSASVPLQKRLWQCVVKEKIRSQASLLKKLHGNDFGLLEMSKQVLSGDTENMEGRAAALYWKHLFPKPFLRERQNPDNNLLLNYGYAILRAMTARACCGAGLHPTLGINHHNRYNPYCLADDLMEPYRWIIDKKTAELNPGNTLVEELNSFLRRELLSVLLEKVETSNGNRQLTDLLQHSAVMVAESFQKGEMLLHYS